jgi:hypothetical protein
MAFVKFATTCDVRSEGLTCGKRSEEYRAWPICLDCGIHVCDDHQVNGTVREREGEDVDGVPTMVRYCYCVECG